MKIYIKKVINRISKDIKNVWPLFILLAIYAFITQKLFGTVCPFRIFLHIKCPGCGLTHSCLYILSGNFKEALKWNIAGFFWLPYLSILLIWRYLIGKRFPFIILGVVICAVVTIIQWLF